MKLLSQVSPLVLLSKLASATSDGYASTCTEDGFVEITIPYSNSIGSELLSAVAPTCNARGASSEHHTYNFDEANSQAILKLNIESCGLGEVYNDPVLRAESGFYMAAANVSIGVRDEVNGIDLTFYNAFLGAECGQKLDYTIVYDYKKIQKHEQTGCHAYTPEGECIVAAYDSYSFVFKEYVSGDFEELVGDDAQCKKHKKVQQA